MENEILKQYEKSDLVYLPKGENKQFWPIIAKALGITEPVFAGRCLHGER